MAAPLVPCQGPGCSKKTRQMYGTGSVKVPACAGCAKTVGRWSPEFNQGLRGNLEHGYRHLEQTSSFVRMWPGATSQDHLDVFDATGKTPVKHTDDIHTSQRYEDDERAARMSYQPPAAQPKSNVIDARNRFGR